MGVFLRRPRFRSPSAPLRCPLHASLRRMCRFYPRTMPTLMTFSRSTAKAFHVSARFRAYQPAASRSRLLSPVATGSRHAHRAVRRLRLPRLAQPRQVRNASVAVAGHPARRNHALTRLTDASARCRGHPSSSTSFLTAHWKYSYPYRHSLGVASLFPAISISTFAGGSLAVPGHAGCCLLDVVLLLWFMLRPPRHAGDGHGPLWSFFALTGGGLLSGRESERRLAPRMPH